MKPEAPGTGTVSPASTEARFSMPSAVVYEHEKVASSASVRSDSTTATLRMSHFAYSANPPSASDPKYPAMSGFSGSDGSRSQASTMTRLPTGPGSAPSPTATASPTTSAP